MITITTITQNGSHTRKSHIERIKRRVRTAKQTATVAGCGIVTHISDDTKRGFREGRSAGKDLIQNGIPYVAGETIGIGFGVVEGVVGLLAKPTQALFGLGIRMGSWAAHTVGHGSRSNEGHKIEAELA